MPTKIQMFLRANWKPSLGSWELVIKDQTYFLSADSFRQLVIKVQEVKPGGDILNMTFGVVQGDTIKSVTISGIPPDQWQYMVDYLTKCQSSFDSFHTRNPELN